MVVFLVVGLLALLGIVALVALFAVFAILRRPSEEPGGRGAPAARARAGSSTSPSASAFLPPIPPFPSPAHRLAPGTYMFGQLWRWDGTKWSAEIGDDCEPVMAIFDTPMLGTCAVTWDSVHRRTSPGGAWTREYRSPNGRPRLSSGWGHPVHGLFACGGSSTLLHSKGDGVWTRLPVPEAFRTVISAIWGDEEGLFLGSADGRVARTLWSSRGEWQITQTPARDFVFDGVSTPQGHYAIAQSGEVLFLPRAVGATAPEWVVETKLRCPAKGLWADPSGRVWVSGHCAVLRSDRPGQWVSEALEGGAYALASNGVQLFSGGERSVLGRRDAAGVWTLGPPGRSGEIVSLWAGPGGELLVGTEFMIDVEAGGRGRQAEVIASRTVA
ncbi:MAG: hypothetical protein K1X94_07630 [Sandaracinaceae bacterium]|nr:hypothetical protein [Sandaracinaceae bacterium]